MIQIDRQATHYVVTHGESTVYIDRYDNGYRSIDRLWFAAKNAVDCKIKREMARCLEASA